MDKHFKVGGEGFRDSESIYNLTVLGILDRTPQQTQKIVDYLINVSESFKKIDRSLVKDLVAKLHAISSKPGEILLKEDVEDSCMLIILEGSVVK